MNADNAGPGIRVRDDGGDTAFGLDEQIRPSRLVHGFDCSKKKSFSVVITRVDA